MLPGKLIESIRNHLPFIRDIHAIDLKEGFTASLHEALRVAYVARNYSGEG